jgi:hypothetical protein
MKSRMFPFIDKTWNPVVGCKHHCGYCWAEKLATTRLQQLGIDRYRDGFVPKIIDDELCRTFKPGEFVFVSDMGDLFGAWVKQHWIWNVFKAIRASPEARFLLLTKNPSRYLEFEGIIPENCVCAATIETNRDTSEISKAPLPFDRWESFYSLNHPHKILVAEPIMDFDLDTFASWILSLRGHLTWKKGYRKELDMVVVGYDNYKNNLPEPALAKTRKLIRSLEKRGVKVVTKTLRQARTGFKAWPGDEK